MAKVTAATPHGPSGNVSRLSCYRVMRPKVLPSHVRTISLGRDGKEEAEEGRKEKILELIFWKTHLA